HAGERFHLHTSLGNRPCSAFYLRAVIRRDDIDRNMAQRQWVAKGNELRSLFGRLNSGNPRSREDISLCNFVCRNKLDSLSLESNLASHDRSSRAQRLGRNIDHLCAAISGHVSQAFYDSSSDCAQLAVPLVNLVYAM